MILEILMAGQSWSQNIPDYKKCLENRDKEVAAICLISTGNAYGEKGRYKEAEEAFREAIRISPENWITANAYSSLGMTLGRQEKYKEAVVFLQKALKIEPELGSAWSDLGVIYFKIGELDKAIQAFKRVITVSTINEVIDNSYLNLTYIYLIKNDLSNTEQNYEILRTRNPSLTSKFLSELKESRDLWERFQKIQRR